MTVSIVFKNLEHTESVDALIQSKTEKILKYLSPEASIHWVCSIKDKKHQAELHISDRKNHFDARAEDDHLYKSIDQVIQKIKRQLSDKKEKMFNHLHKNRNKNDWSLAKRIA